mgnify:CR=1 FL=1|jgi:hypothetical protein
MPLTEERIDPNPDSFETVPFYNFTSEDFTEEQGAMWNSRPYLVKAGEIKFYPIFLANHLCKHLINRELIRTNETSMLDTKLRETLAKKILISQEEASKLLGMSNSDRIILKVKPTKKKKELISDSEAKSSPISKSKEIEDIPEVEHTSEYKGVDIQPLR